MDEKLIDGLSQTLKMMNDAASSGGNFILEQAPDVARQLVAWQLWGSVAWFIVGLILMLFFIKKIVPWIIHKKDEGLAEGMCAPAGLLLIVTVLLLGVNLSEGIKAAVAPKIVILDYVKEAVAKK